MRRKRQQLAEEESIAILEKALAEEESIAILEKATAGTLALLGDNDYLYAVPISYVYHDGKLYFHSALAGHKVDAIRKCDNECLATATIRIMMKPCKKRLKMGFLACWPSALTSSIWQVKKQ